MVNIKLREILDSDTGAINMTRLLEISNNVQKSQRRPTALLQRKPVPAFSMPQPKPAAMVLRGTNPLVQSTRTKQATAILKPAFQPMVKTKKHSVKLPTARTITVGKVSGSVYRLQKQSNLLSLGNQQIRLPFFLPNVIGAGLLKKWAGQERGTLLKKSGSGWEIVNDSEEINLQDSTQVYKLGEVQIYS